MLAQRWLKCTEIRYKMSILRNIPFIAHSLTAGAITQHPGDPASLASGELRRDRGSTSSQKHNTRVRIPGVAAARLSKGRYL